MHPFTRAAASGKVPAMLTIDLDPTTRLLGEVALTAPATVRPYAVIEGPLWAGPGLRVASFVALGGEAQHRAGSAGTVHIGRDFFAGEFSTVHRGSAAGAGVTRIGDSVFLMAYAHVGHDAMVGDGVSIANGAQLGGHVEVGDGATIGARAAIHQFVRIGKGAMVAAGAFVTGDVPPWSLAAGDRARISGPNAHTIRPIFGPEGVSRVRRALRILLGGGTRAELGPWDGPDPALDIADFLQHPGPRRRAPRGWV